METISVPKPSKFHGYSVMPRIDNSNYAKSITPQGCTAVQLHIGHLPNRKGLCLYVAETNKFCAQVTPLAFFKTEEAAKAAQSVLDWMILKVEPTPQS